MQIASKAKAIRLAARLAGFESEQHRHGEAPSLMMSTRSLETMDIIYFRTDDTVASKQAMQFLPEGRTYSIDNKWSVRADKAHVQGMKNHNHIQLKGSEVAVINT